MIRVKRRGSSTELEGFPELAVLEPDALGIEITAGPTVQNMGKGNSPQGRESRMIWGAVNDGTSQPTVGYAGPDAEVSIVGWNFDTEIMGLPNMAGRLAADASALFARNHLNFLTPFIKDGALALPDDDELVKGIRLTQGGAVVHPNLKTGG